MTKCYFLLQQFSPLTLFFLLPVFCFSQGLIVNEVSNNGGLEYIELLVIGSAADPTGPVDVTGWFIDDDNGSFSGFNSPSTTARAIYLDGSCFTTLNPGDLILIYNENDVNPSILSLPLVPDETDADANGTYIIPGSSACLNMCIFFPSNTDSTYNCGVFAGSGTWSAMSLRDDGDALQVRQPNGDFFHGFSYGDINTRFPVFPSGASSFNLGSGVGANFSFFCGDFTASSNYIRRNATSASNTPGLPNSPENVATIVEIRAGRFDYTNLSDPDNCGTVLSPKIESFKAQSIKEKVLLSWEVNNRTDIANIIIERATNNQAFEIIAQVSNSANNPAEFVDDKPQIGNNLYRLRLVDVNRYEWMSKTVEIMMQHPSVYLKSVYFHSNDQMLNMSLSLNDLQPFEVRIYDFLGKMHYIQMIKPIFRTIEHHMDVEQLPKGAYILHIRHANGLLQKKWLKN